jgi:[ribosomal protein S5]-alanine N-acetyltransferase
MIGLLQGFIVSSIPLNTERLLLRDYVVTDWQSVHEYACDPDVIKYLDWGPNTVAESQTFIDRVMEVNQAKPRFGFELAVVLKEQSRMIGGGTVYIINPKYREGSIGYCLNKQFWGQGFATEIAKTLLKFAFFELKLHRVFATAHPDNIASANILRKIGMKHEGRLRDHKFVRGNWRDTDVYALLESECPA